ncbi:hypothetical protein H5410_002349 [Solanum commersonii]|uniref:Uncharacterized protein n=1 Tax=Solanum commersonii TaxID=4109 RepID=A0A9J6B1T3_SOLCO|nr:hypothetical protein H5410_002349 [Solanum commersonii]
MPMVVNVYTKIILFKRLDGKVYELLRGWVCYVETSNVDEETSLKVKHELNITSSLYDDGSFQNFKVVVKFEDPNEDLYSFIGTPCYDNQQNPLSVQQIVLRGPKPRNTNYVYGVVIFIGHETKVMQNSAYPPSKRSGIEKRMDKIIYVLFIKYKVASRMKGTIDITFHKLKFLKLVNLDISKCGMPRRNPFLLETLVVKQCDNLDIFNAGSQVLSRGQVSESGLRLRLSIESGIEVRVKLGLGLKLGSGLKLGVEVGLGSGLGLMSGSAIRCQGLEWDRGHILGSGVKVESRV